MSNKNSLAKGCLKAIKTASEHKGECSYCGHCFNSDQCFICKGWKPITKKDIPFTILMNMKDV